MQEYRITRRGGILYMRVSIQIGHIRVINSRCEKKYKSI